MHLHSTPEKNIWKKKKILSLERKKANLPFFFEKW
jgi:hypothetical protein